MLASVSDNSDTQLSSAVKRVVEHGSRAGVHIVPLTLPVNARTAREAATALDIDIAQIVKSLVFVVAGIPTLALVAGIDQLDEARLSAAVGGGTVLRANADIVRETTGFAIGGVAPFGSIQALQAFIDRTLLAHDIVYAAAGRPDTVFAISPPDLVKASGAMTWDLARD